HVSRQISIPLNSRQLFRYICPEYCLPMSQRSRPNSLAVFILLAALSATALVAGQTRPAPAPAPVRRTPALEVVLVVDQMRADYLDRFPQQWTGGLKRLLSTGARFRLAQYPYSGTVTCAGHGTIGTGTFPSTHGMVMNAWYDRGLQKE